MLRKVLLCVIPPLSFEIWKYASILLMITNRKACIQRSLDFFQTALSLSVRNWWKSLSSLRGICCSSNMVGEFPVLACHIWGYTGSSTCLEVTAETVGVGVSLFWGYTDESERTASSELQLHHGKTGVFMDHPFSLAENKHNNKYWY